MNNILNVNYDDFYKFSVSAGIIVFITSCIIATYFLPTAKPYNLAYIDFIVYLIFSIVGASWAGYGIFKWKDNQKLLDKKLFWEVKLLETENKIRQREYERLNYELNTSIPIISRNHKFPGEAVVKPEKKEEI